MHRVYSNRLPGQRRIHIEISPTEIADLLADLGDEGPYDHPATDTLVDLLTAAHALFVEDEDDAHDAARQATGQADTEPRTHGMDPAAILGAWTGCAPECAECNDTGACNGGPCAHPAAPVVGQPAAAPDTEARPPVTSWTACKRGDTDWLVASSSFTDRDQALERLARRRREQPHAEFALVRETTTWTVEDETR